VTKFLSTYIAGLPIDRLPEVLDEAVNWGLLRPAELKGYVSLQPILPYFLRGRLQQEETAFTNEAAPQTDELYFRQA
jgi:hypothetical protein